MGDEREGESIRTHRQLPVCRNEPFFSSELSIAVTRELSLWPRYWNRACYSYAALHWVSFGMNRVMRLSRYKSPILFYTARSRGHEISMVCVCLSRGVRGRVWKFPRRAHIAIRSNTHSARRSLPGKKLIVSFIISLHVVSTLWSHVFFIFFSFAETLEITASYAFVIYLFCFVITVLKSALVGFTARDTQFFQLDNFADKRNHRHKHITR